jgi:hypothetical protein
MPSDTHSSRRRPSRPKRNRLVLAAVAVAFVVLGYFIAIAWPSAHPVADNMRAKARGDAISSIASVPSPTTSPTQPRVTPSHIPRQSPKPTPSASLSTAAARSSATSACGRTYTSRSESWPNCSNTGMPPGIALRHRSGDITIARSGTVIDDVYLTGSLDIYANNVTIENSTIHSSGWWGIFQRPGYSGLRVLHDTITGNVAYGPDSGGEDTGVWSLGRSATIAYNNISEFGANISVIAGHVYNNFLHDEQAFGSEGIGGCNPLPRPIPERCYNHSDSFGLDAGHHIMLRHNTILEAPIPGADAAVELDEDLGTVSHVTVTDNFLAGGNYCTYAASNIDAAPSMYIVYTDNAFSTLYYPDCGYFGAVAYWNSAGKGNVWSGNYWADGRRAGRRVR